MIFKSLDLIEKKKEKFIPQSEIDANLCKKNKKMRLKLIGSKKQKNYCKNKWTINPGSWFEINGIELSLVKAIEVESKWKTRTDFDDNFTIGCSENAVQILELQKEGKQKMTTKEFLRGSDLKVGTYYFRMFNYMLKIEYVGSNFVGWQISKKWHFNTTKD